MSSYLEAALGEICDVRIGRARTPQHQIGPNMVPYIRAANIKDGVVGLDDLLEMNFTPSEQKLYGLQLGDVLVTEACGSPAELGASAQWRGAPADVVCFQNHVLRLRALEGISDGGYLTHLARWCQRTGRWLAVASGTGILNIGQQRARGVRVPAPPVGIQRKIGVILTAYDDLIENNNCRIKILEEMAHRIYREWFVDFRYPGHENVPLVDSKLGQIPEGWIGGALQDVVAYHIGGGWGADEVSSSYDRLARVIRGTDIPRIRRGDVSSCPVRYHTAANIRSRLLREGDIVFEVSGGSKGQPVGRSALISTALINELGMDTICASFCKLVRADQDIFLPELLSYRLLDAYDNGEMSTYQVQSTGITNLRFSQFLESFPVSIPPMPIQSMFVNCVGSMASTINLLGIQIRNLRAARDLLLPRLMSGEIDVTDLKIALPEAAS